MSAITDEMRSLLKSRGSPASPDHGFTDASNKDPSPPLPVFQDSGEIMATDEAQVGFLDDSGSEQNDSNDVADDRDWRRNRTAPAPRNRILLQIFCATGLIALFATVAWLFYPSATSSGPHAPDKTRGSIKVMIVGDSISQGYEGDYTWRYRLWQWFRDSDHEDVSFVGPFIGTFPPPDHQRLSLWRPLEKPPVLEVRDWGGYALDVDPAFLAAGDNAHFAHWGRQAAQFRDIIEDAVRQAQPDYVIFALGFNDLAWRWWPDQLIEIVEDLVTNARAAKADVKFAVANVVHRLASDNKAQLPINTRMYNTMLEEAITGWRTEESPVELVRMRESYECDPWSCPASHDGLHPNALGEYQIARAFVHTLHEKYGLGSSNFTIPSVIPPRPCSPPANVKVVVTAEPKAAATATAQSAETNSTTMNSSTIHVAWDSFYGAYAYHMQAQLKGGDWAVLPAQSEKSYADKNSVGLGEDWEVRVRSYCGDQQPSSDWSKVISVRT